MKQVDLKDLLKEFRSLPAETECIEFKEAKTTFDIDRLGQIFLGTFQ